MSLFQTVSHSRLLPTVLSQQTSIFKLFNCVQALKKMNAGDTPLNTVALFSEKQKQGQTPYLILSGGGQTFSSG